MTRKLRRMRRAAAGLAVLLSLACERSVLIAPEGGPSFADRSRSQTDASLLVLHPQGLRQDTPTFLYDVRPQWSYKRGHAAFAISSPVDEMLGYVGRGAVIELDFTTKRNFAERFDIRTGLPLVIYDDPIAGHGEGALALYLLREKLGLKNVTYLDGGRHAAPIVGTWTTEVPEFQPWRWTDPSLTPTSRGLSAKEIDGLRGDPETVILDVRSPAEFAGEEKMPSIKGLWGLLPDLSRRGHIPDVKNFYWRVLLTRSGYLRPRGEIEKLLTEVGATPNKRIVVYDGAMYRSSFVWMVLKELGYENVVNFEGGLLAWTQEADLPLERGP